MPVLLEAPIVNGGSVMTTTTIRDLVDEIRANAIHALGPDGLPTKLQITMDDAEGWIAVRAPWRSTDFVHVWRDDNVIRVEWMTWNEIVKAEARFDENMPIGLVVATVLAGLDLA
jgi:hypothetical protein